MWMDQCAGDQGDQSDLQRNKTNTESQTPKTDIGQRSRAAFEIGSDIVVIHKITGVFQKLRENTDDGLCNWITRNIKREK